MPSDEELRRVAEDMRALARSLARDFWDATQSARGSGRPPGEALRHGVRDALHGARREFRDEMWRRRSGWWAGPPGYRHGWPGYGRPGRGWTDRGWTGADPDGRDGQFAGRGPAGAPGGPPGGFGGSPLGGFPGRSPDGFPGRRPGGSRRGYRDGPAHPRPGRSRPRGSLPPVRRRWDAPLLAALLVAVFGAAWLAGGLGAAHLSVEAVLAAGLMLLGATLIVTARTDWGLSRHAWPVILGVVLVVGLFATSTTFGVSGALSHLSFGRVDAVPTGTQTVYGGVGQLDVDATRLAAGSTLRIQSIAGQTDVTLPPDRTVTVQGQVLAGQVCVDGRSFASGLGASSAPIQLPAADGHPHGAVTIYIHQLAGRVLVGATGCRP